MARERVSAADRWKRQAPAGWPPPEVYARPAEPHEIPTGAARVAKLAEKHGWSYDVRYSRGTTDGRPRRVVDTVAIRARRGGIQLWATWTEGKAAHAQIRRPGEIARNVNIATIKNEITREEEQS